MMNQITLQSRILLVVSAIFLIVAIFVPLWRIELDAPQYPEGLMLLIYANKLGGNVEIINGLNHYIGMKTLHTADFVEFTILPYLISFYALLFIWAAIKRTKKWLYISLIGLALFGIVSMIDFYMWEYNYGHNLDPNAAIIVPGMAYQPPLIGFKQLLNFGAYSIPDIGGWLFIGSGLLLLFAALMEAGVFRRFRKRKVASIIIIGFVFTFTSCGETGPQVISLNKDKCDNCRMTISDGRFAAELITSKNRIYKFDDIICLKDYIKSNAHIPIQACFVSDYENANELVDVNSAWFINHENFKSPMNGNIAAFNNEVNAKAIAEKLNVPSIGWNELNKD